MTNGVNVNCHFSGVGDGAGEGGVENREVFGEREGMGLEKALEEADLVRLGPDSVELERRGLGLGGRGR